MPFNPLTTGEIQAGQPVVGAAGFAGKVKDCLDWLYANLSVSGGGGTGGGAPAISNGSFEIDGDSDQQPDTWTVALYPGGSRALQTSVRSHGLKAMQFTHPGGAGNGGGSITSDYLLVTALQKLYLSWAYYTTNAAMKVVVNAQWYNGSQVLLGTTELYNSVSNPTSWARVAVDQIATYSGAVYVRFAFLCGYTDTDQAGSVYLDDVRLDQAQPLSCSLIAAAGHVADPGGTAYFPLSGGLDVTGVTPPGAPKAGYFRRLRTTGLVSSDSLTLLKGGVATALTVSGSSPNDLSNVVSFAAGEAPSIRIITAAEAKVMWCLEFVSYPTIE